MKDYDYALSGAYFVTVCACQRQCLFGRIVNEEMHFNTLGTLVAAHLVDIPGHFPSTELDLWVVMPNHLHAIIVLHEDGSIRLTDVIGNFKAAVTRAWRGSQGRINDNATMDEIDHRRGGIYAARTHGTEPPHTNEDLARTTDQLNPSPTPIWHRSFHDHIIRNERALNQIRQYIRINPARWSEDHYFRA
ncbi:MAG: hypothetical protein IT320_27120 [Anaerolineae bacterium]|nr:hypothetical protein [Anaerolineae bacterium]